MTAVDSLDPSVHLDLGNALRGQGRQEEALEAFQQALALRPGWPMALYNLGIAHLDLGDAPKAFAAFQGVVAVRPEWSLGHSGLGIALLTSGKLQEAKASLQKALALDPEIHMTRHYLGLALGACQEVGAVISCYQEGLRSASSTCPECRAFLGTWLLALGDYPEGFREYEWRWAAGGRTPCLSGLSCPVWDGSRLDGRSIVLWDEQGLGDILQFIRFAAQVHEREGTVQILCRPNLRSLLATCPGVARAVSRLEDLEDCEYQLPLASLPGLLGTTLENLPAEIPYLTPPVPCAGHPFGPRQGGELRVGFVWGVEPGHPNWQGRSCPLPLFRCLESVPGVELYSLQFGARAAELRRPDAPRAADLSAVLGDFGQTAALVDHLDLVVTVDTSMTHLAGALGKPVWTLIPYDADWRWLRGREDSPWYPTMRLFRQEERGRWAPVLERVAAALREMTPAMPRSGEVA